VVLRSAGIVGVLRPVLLSSQNKRKSHPPLPAVSVLEFGMGAWNSCIVYIVFLSLKLLHIVLPHRIVDIKPLNHPLK
jgi:hypothetical protein